jgi:hypothetical protein
MTMRNNRNESEDELTGGIFSLFINKREFIVGDRTIMGKTSLRTNGILISSDWINRTSHPKIKISPKTSQTFGALGQPEIEEIEEDSEYCCS